MLVSRPGKAARLLRWLLPARFVASPSRTGSTCASTRLAGSQNPLALAGRLYPAATLGALAAFIRRDLRDFIPSWPWGIGVELLGPVATLLIFWFTSRAFASSLSFDGKDYFQFALVGEAMLLVPLVLFEGGARAVRSAAADGSLDLFLAEPLAVQNPLLLACLAGVPRELLRAASLFFLASLFFHPDLPALRLGLGFGFAILAAPAFLGMGQLGAAFLVCFGRGSALLAQIGTLATIFAGAYFPLTVFPERARSALEWSVPFAAYLRLVRAFLARGWTTDLWWPTLVLCGTGVLWFFLGYAALGWSFRLARRRGSPLVFPV